MVVGLLSWVVYAQADGGSPSIDTIGQYGIAAIFIIIAAVLYRDGQKRQDKLEALAERTLLGLAESSAALQKVVASMTDQVHKAGQPNDEMTVIVDTLKKLTADIDRRLS